MDRTVKGDDALWLALTAWYVTVLALCATAGPGEGLFGAALALLPAAVHAWLYAPAAGLVAWLLSRCFELRQWSAPAGLVVSTLFALLFVGFLEVAQAWQQGRAPLVTHIGWAGLGILLTWVLIRVRPQPAVQPQMRADVLPFRRLAGRTRKGSSS